MGYLWFDTDTILDHTAREGAADSEALEQSSYGVTQTQSQQVLKQRQTQGIWKVIMFSSVQLQNNILGLDLIIKMLFRDLNGLNENGLQW